MPLCPAGWVQSAGQRGKAGAGGAQVTLMAPVRTAKAM